MAKTPNLKLNLFNGNDRPNHELFNQNNEIIDDILVNAKTHNHDGVNSAKIKATNVVFDKGNTTLKAENLEDAVKEVFQEADSKINWITDTIGRTSSGQSNPDIKVNEIQTDFNEGREIYLNNMKQSTIFNVEGGLPDSNASINEIADAINNTIFKDATATRDDMLSEAYAITRHGMAEYGTINPIDYASIVPSNKNDVTVSKGMYKELFLQPFPVSNPAMHIRKGCNILGIDGLLNEHGSNGWDIEEEIPKDKLEDINKNGGIYYKSKVSGSSAHVSISEPYTLQISSNKYLKAQHFSLIGSTLYCYSPDFKQHTTINLSSISSFKTSNGLIQENYMTGKRMLKIFREENFGTTSLFAAIAYSNKLYIIDLINKSIKYKYPSSGYLNMEISEIAIETYRNHINDNVTFIGKDGYVSCIPVYSDATSELMKYKGYKGHSLGYRYANIDKYAYVELLPKETKSSAEVNDAYTITTNMECNDDEIILTTGDAIKIRNLLNNHTAFELTYSLPLGSGTTTITVTDKTGTVCERIQTSSTALTTKTISCSDPSEVTITCTQGKVKIKGVNIPEVGNGTVNKLFSTDWGFLGCGRIYGEVKCKHSNSSIPYSYLLIGGHEKNLQEGQCKAIFSVLCFGGVSESSKTASLFLGKKLVVDEMYAGEEYGYLDTALIHRPLSFMSEYDNYIYGTYPDLRFEHSTVSAAGYRYHKFKRKLIKLDFSVSTDYTAPLPVLTQENSCFTYKLFRPTFINYKGELIGLEQSCTLEKFTYVTKLNKDLISKNCFEAWSEVEWRTAEEEFRILDDGTTMNTIQFPKNVIRAYDTNGKISNTKLFGDRLKGQKESNRKTEVTMEARNDNLLVSNGLFAIYNPAYKIIGIKQ